MTLLSVEPFKVSISEDELENLRKRLELTRLPTGMSECQWADSPVTVGFIQEMVSHWIHEYDWDAEQQRINQMPQFKARIELEEEELGMFDVHFIHVRSTVRSGVDNIPLLFLHGWPGNFTEVSKVLGPLENAGYHVVAPSLPGFGFSSYTTKAGLKNWHHGMIMHRLMTGLGYEKYVVVGSDWGAMIAGSMAKLYPETVQAIYITNVFVHPPENHAQLSYTPFEQHSLARNGWFNDSEAAYGQIQRTKPRTLGFAMHDSPAGLLAWMADKLLLWADEYPWTRDELITWTLLHYFPGPTTAFQIYRENLPLFARGDTVPPGVTERYVSVPTGVGAFPQEVFIVPRSWAEREYNIVAWTENARGGHFPAYETPDDLCAHMIPFLRSQWEESTNAA